MGSIFVVNFGKENGIQRYRINGTLDQIMKVLQEASAMGHVFSNDPQIEHVRKFEYTAWLELKLPPNPKTIKEHA